jgi:SpoIID/LytB domain protein
MPRAAGRRRALFAVLAAALLGPVGAVAGWPGRGGAAQPPGHLTFRGHGFGHGIGMSQYGAYGMALRGYGARGILGFYYPGARLRRVALPGSVRVGLVQANQPAGRGLALRGARVPGLARGGALVVSGRSGRGRQVARVLARGVRYVLRPERGGLSLFAGRRRVFGPTRRGGGVTIWYQVHLRRPALLELPQLGRTLRHGRLQVSPAGPGLRAVAVMPFTAYLDGLAEMPGSWPRAALRAQAVAARSYALATVLAHGQHRGRARWDGCDCGVYGDTRDQFYAGWAKERGRGGARWVAAVRDTGAQVLTYRRRAVRAFYSASSGGWTQSAAVWGGVCCMPARRDPWDAAGGRNPLARWSVTRGRRAVGQALARLGVGTVLGLGVAATDASGRVTRVLVRGSRGSAQLSGGRLRALLGLASTRFRITPLR